MYDKDVKKVWALFGGFSPPKMDDKLDPWCFLGSFQELRIQSSFFEKSLYLLVIT